MWARVLTVVLVVGVSGRALADGVTTDPIQRASKHVDEGLGAYKAKAFEDAAGHFEAAFDAAANAQVLRLAIRSRDAAGQLDRAATLAALALARYPEDAECAKLASGILKSARGTLAEVTIRCTASCILTVNEVAVAGGFYGQFTVYVKPGATTIHASFAGGGEVVRHLDARATAPTTEELSPAAEPEVLETPPVRTPPEKGEHLSSEPTVVPTPSERESGGLPEQPVAPFASHALAHAVTDADGNGAWYQGRGLFFTLLAATAGAGGVALWSGIDTLNNPGKDAVRNACAGQGVECPEYQLGLQKQERTTVLIGATAGVGAATLLVGAALTEFSPAARVHAAVWVTPGNAGVAVRGAF